MSDSVLNVGDIRVTSLSDGNCSVFDPRLMFPDTPLEHWSHYYDIFPECFSGKHFLMNLGVFVMSSGGKNVIADTGIWSAWEDVGFGYFGGVDGRLCA